MSKLKLLFGREAAATPVTPPPPGPIDIPILEPDAAWVGVSNPANIPPVSATPYGTVDADRRAVGSHAVPPELVVDGVQYFTIDPETLAPGGIARVEAKIEAGPWTEIPYGPHPVDGKYGWQVGVRARDGQDGRATLITRHIPAHGRETITATELVLKRSGALQYADRWIDASAAPGGNALTPGTPAQTLQQAISSFTLSDVTTRLCRIFMAAGTYQWTVLQWGTGNAFVWPVQFLGADPGGDPRDPATVMLTKIDCGFLTDSRFRHSLGSEPPYFENIEFDFGNAVRYPNGGNIGRCRLRQSLIGPAMPLHRPEFGGGHTKPVFEPLEIPAQTPNFGAQPVSGVWTTSSGPGWTVWESDVQLVAFDMVRRRWLNNEACQMDMVVFQNLPDNCIMDCRQTQIRNYEQRLHPAVEAAIASAADNGDGNTRIVLARESTVYATSATNPISISHVAGTTTLSVTNNPQPVVSFAASSTAARRHWNTIRVWVNGVPEDRTITGVTAVGSAGDCVLTIDAPFSAGFSGPVQYETTFLTSGEIGQSYFRFFDPNGEVAVGDVPFPEMPDGTRQQPWHGWRIVSNDIPNRAFVIDMPPALAPALPGVPAQGMTIGHGDGGAGQVFPATNLWTAGPLRVGVLRRIKALCHSWQSQLAQPGWHPVLAAPDGSNRITGGSATLTKPGGFAVHGILASHALGSIVVTIANPTGWLVNYRVDDHIVVAIDGEDHYRRITEVVSQNELRIESPFPEGFSGQNFNLSCSVADWIFADSIVDKAGQDYEIGQNSASLVNVGWLRCTQPNANGVDVAMLIRNANAQGCWDFRAIDCILSGWTHERTANDWPPEAGFVNCYFMLAAHVNTPDFMKPTRINPFTGNLTVRGQNTVAGARDYRVLPGIVTNVPTRSDGVDINWLPRADVPLIGARID